MRSLLFGKMPSQTSNDRTFMRAVNHTCCYHCGYYCYGPFTSFFFSFIIILSLFFFLLIIACQLLVLPLHVSIVCSCLHLLTLTKRKSITTVAFFFFLPFLHPRGKELFDHFCLLTFLCGSLLLTYVAVYVLLASVPSYLRFFFFLLCILVIIVRLLFFFVCGFFPVCGASFLKREKGKRQLEDI